MTLDLFVILMSWAAMLSGYDIPETMPEVVFKDHQFFVDNACLGKECDAQAWYNDQKIVYLDAKYAEYSEIQWFGKTLLVHEFVHYLQDINGDTEPGCGDFVERELKAYWVQRRFISEGLSRLDPIRPKVMACVE